MKTEHPIDEGELQAYMDDALDPERRRAVEAYLARESAACRQIERQVAERSALREALAPIVDEPIPPRLYVTRLLAQRSRGVRARPWQLAAAGLMLFTVGAASGYQLHASHRPSAGVSALAREASDSYRVHAVDPARPVEIDAAGKAELVRWFSERLQSPVAVPDLLAAGYHFLGGRLVTTPHGAAALFVYEGAAGSKLAVLVRPMAIEKDTRMSEHVDGVLGTVAWAAHGIGYSLVAAVAPNELHPLADEVRRQLALARDG